MLVGQVIPNQSIGMVGNVSDPSEQRVIYRVRTYRQRIKRTNEHEIVLYEKLNNLTIKSKCLYNLAVYMERQYFFQNEQIIPWMQLIVLLQGTEAYKALPSQTSCKIIKQAANAFYNFQKATASYMRDPKRFNGKPKLPKYKDSYTTNIVYFTFQQLKIVNGDKLRLPKGIGTLKIPKYLLEKGIEIKKTEIDLDIEIEPTQLLEIRIVPRYGELYLEYVYEEPVLVSNKATGKYKAAIDLGLDNFAAIAFYKPDTNPIIINGKGLKSYNQNFYRQYKRLKTEAVRQNLSSTHRIDKLVASRDRYMNTWMHKASRLTVNILLSEGCNTVVIGHNNFQKKNMKLKKKIMQQFHYVPYCRYIEMMKYKCREAGINVIVTEESYTSGTSFLDNEEPVRQNYNIKRRKYRGLFKSETMGSINSDVNAAFQILKKVYPNQVVYLSCININPTKLNIA